MSENRITVETTISFKCSDTMVKIVFREKGAVVYDFALPIEDAKRFAGAYQRAIEKAVEMAKDAE